MLRKTLPSLLLFVMFGSGATSSCAQDEPDAPAPKQNASPSPQDTQGQNSGPANDPQVGKNKLEKETGTVNDRIFEVMPNYGTVETGNDP